MYDIVSLVLNPLLLGRVAIQYTQDFSYRKQIARQLRTQYVEGIYRPKHYTVTLKSRLKVIQGHWKKETLDRSYTTYY